MRGWPHVLTLAAVCLLVVPAVATPYPTVIKLGPLQNAALTESSGVVAGRRNRGLFWTHNDSGDGPFVYALGPHGEDDGTFQLQGMPTPTDCEDIAIGPGPQHGLPYLYLGDIGDNNSVRKSCCVWRVLEPRVTAEAKHSDQKHPVLTGTAEALPYVYPDGPHDAETLMVHPQTGRIYVVAKNTSGVDGVYAFPMPLAPGKTVTLAKVATVHISGEPPVYPNLVTGGDIAPDGRRLVIRTYWFAYEFHLPAGMPSFDAIWMAPPTRIVLPLQPQGEGIGYLYPKGDGLVLTSEGRGTTFYLLRRKEH